jgi:sugar lactone lactonase YvrE
MKKLFFLLIIMNAPWADAQTIFTISGDGTEGFTGDGGLAITAELALPSGVAVDSIGNIYIADNRNHCIRKINTSGVISTVAGNRSSGFSGDGGLATAAQLYYPNDMTLDKAGNLYIVDNQNNRIRKVNTSGIISTIAGNGGQGFSGDGGPAIAAQLQNPTGVATDSSGNVYIADGDNNRIRKVSTLGIITTVAGDSIGGYNGDGILATKAELNDPTDIRVDKAGNLYIADFLNDRIRMVNTSGIISTVAGFGSAGYIGNGGPATAAYLNGPDKIALDAAGNIFISDFYNKVIRKVNTSGIITTFAGNGTQGYSGDGGPATSAEISLPQGIAVDGGGTLYIADAFNNRIRKVSMATGINELILNDADFTKAYPNPSNGIFNILTNRTTSSVLEFYNILGELIHTEKTVSDKTQIDLSSQPKGMYFYRVVSQNKIIGSGKLVIQ